MEKQELQKLLSSEYNRGNWIQILTTVFKSGKVFSKPQPADLPGNNHKEAWELGKFSTYDDYEISVFEVEVADKIDLDRNRVSLRNLLNKYYKRTEGVFAVFKQDNRWRFSFVSQRESYDAQEDGWINIETDTKRYTYVLGEDEVVKTPASRFYKLVDKERVEFSDIEEAFSVEALNREFFKKYKEHYHRFWKYLADKENGYREKLIDDSKNSESEQTKPIRDFVKKLLGRIVFLHFLQKKGWMGCPGNSTEWKNGEKQFMYLLFQNFEPKEKFYSQCLVQLFFGTLNTKREGDYFKVNGLKGKLNGSRIPYLNGGLFDPEKNESTQYIDFPVEFFSELLEFFQQYNFTIDENSPEDQEVGIDPEMLGHIFENLLEENREKGAFYTPKEIVQYMCKESLMEYLGNSFDDHNEIEFFIKKHQVSEDLRDSKKAELLNQKLDEIKVCDPAIGSGAFPIGMLQEIYKAKRFIYPHLNSNEPFDPSAVKKNIIQNSIYGVDIEKGAVDIAQLRFWLSLVVEEINPEPLPNLDYKIMQGDSLLEQYEGIDLGRIAFMDEPQVTMISDLFAGTAEEPQTNYAISEKDLNSIKNLVALYFEEEDKAAKTKIHKRIDELVIEHIDKSLEFFENKLLIKIAEQEEKLEKKLNNLSDNKKKEYREKSKELKEINKLEKRRANISESRKRLLKFEETDERPYFLWHLYFMDVFEEGGFDVMIGNPPYIQLQSIREQANQYEKVGFDTFRRTGDIYCLFYEQGFNLLKKKGVLTYITSNKWMRGGYGKDLRDYFTTVNTKKIINLGPSVFYSATVDTNIYIGKKESFENDVRGFIINKRDSIKRLKDDQLIPLPDVSTDAWVVLDKEELRINELLEEVGTPLEEWDLEIYRGVLTGYNTAFIIDQKKRDELVEKDPNLKDVIKPILKGREIDRFTSDWSNYIVFLPWHFPLHKDDTITGASMKAEGELEEKYPVLYSYLKSHEKGLKNRNKAETGIRYEWYALQRCAATYYEEFKKEKIIWKRIGSIMRFAYSPDEMFCLDSTCIATGEKIKYLTAVLNSKVGLYQLFKTSPQTGTGDQIISVQALEPFLAPYPNEEVEQKINNLVDIILFIKSWDKTENERIIEALSEPTVSKVFEDVVDHMVYELYFEEHMKEKEINVIDLVDFPTLAKFESKEEKKNIVRQLHQRLRKKDDEIRNRMMLAFTRSPNIIKKINDIVVQ